MSGSLLPLRKEEYKPPRSDALRISKESSLLYISFYKREVVNVLAAAEGIEGKFGSQQN